MLSTYLNIEKIIFYEIHEQKEDVECPSYKIVYMTLMGVFFGIYPKTIFVDDISELINGGVGFVPIDGLVQSKIAQL